MRLKRPLSYANVMSTLAVVIALAGTSTAVAAVVITSNSQVAKATISGHHLRGDAHSNIIRGSINATDLSLAYKASVKTHCPSDMTRTHGLCFDTAARSSAKWLDAAQACAADGRHLPSLGELVLAYQTLATRQDSEWTDQLYSNSASGIFAMEVDMDAGGKLSYAGGNASSLLVPFRCVREASN